MLRHWPIAGIWLVFGMLAAGSGAALAQEFPFNRDLLLDARPMRPGKRMPGISVAPDGSAVLDLWCRSIPARVTIGGDTVEVEAPELPAEPPAQQSAGQCTPERMAADEAMRMFLLGATNWRRKGDAVEFSGAATLLFRPMTN
ncbi:MAG: hypothetical protein JOZ70_14075 [Pseudolabrys sp.]|nr:hypothetical protein [Pseudolabrys sp.]MBV9956365.1 hypothetical protein [Pseudolabrys sp.]